MYDQYANKRQILKDLSESTGYSKRHLQRLLDKELIPTGEVYIPHQKTSLLLDATFFGRSYGVLVSRILGRNIHWKHIDGEKLIYYEQLLHDLEALNFPFSSFVIDGRRGVKELLQKMFPGLPIQHCQFHQKQTVIQCISKNPKLEAGKELLAITHLLQSTSRLEFEELLLDWHGKWDWFLKERTESFTTGKKIFTHQRLRKAFFSLRRNLPYLFTYKEYPELNIPNTTNSCDGSFSHWKNKVKIHRGLRPDRRIKMIDYLLSIS